MADTGASCRLLCHLVVGHGINCLAVGMRRLLRWQPVHRSSVGWWLFLGFHELALHHRGGEAGHTDKVLSTYLHNVYAVEVLQPATILCGEIYGEAGFGEEQEARE